MTLVHSAANILYQARQRGEQLTALPLELVPTTEAQAMQVQDEVARLMGPVVGWKVGASSPDEEPNRAPIHAETLFVRPARLPAKMFHYIGVEAELVYKFAHDLDPAHGPFSRAHVLAAVESVHAAIEIVDTRFAVWDSQPMLAHRADQGNHGALAVGPALADWQTLQPTAQQIILEINGEVVSDRIGGNSAGNPEDLLVWLANVGAVSLGGIKAGQYVTTGSCSATVMVQAPARVRAMYPKRGEISLTID